MRKSVAWSAVFLAAIVLGVCGRLPLMRAGEPAPGQGGDPFGPPSIPEKPKTASSEAKSADDPFGAPDSAAGKAEPAEPKHKPVKLPPTRKRAHGEEALEGDRPASSPQPSGTASMKITAGKASGGYASAQRVASVRTIEKALLRPVTLDVVETPLDKVAEQLSRQSDVDVLVDKKALHDIGLDTATPLTCKVTNVSLRFALRQLLRPCGLTWVILDGALLLTTPEVAETLFTTEVYDVSALLVNAPDYPAGRSSDLGDTDPLFGPPEKTGPEGMGLMNIYAGTAMGGGRGDCVPPGQRRPRTNIDDLVDSAIAATDSKEWEERGGPCSITALPSQQMLVVNATGAMQEEVADYLDMLRRHVETRPQIRIEAHWLWLTEKELAAVLGDQDKGRSSAGDVVEEAAWKKLLQEKQKSRDEGYEPAEAFQAILKGQNGQLISGVSGRQTRVMITLIPVVGDPPAAGAGGLMPPVPAPAPPQTPAPPVQTPAIPSPAPTYPSHTSAVGYQPVCRTIQEGGALEVRPCVVAEGKEILLDLHSRFVQREDHPTAQPQAPASGVAAGANNAVAAGVNNAVAGGANTGVAAGANSAGTGPAANVVRAVAAAVDRPVIYHYRLESTLRVPAGRRVLAGGLADVEGGSGETSLYLFVKATVLAGK